jgi:hypothetical protein
MRRMSFPSKEIKFKDTPSFKLTALEADGLVGPSLQDVSKRKSRYKLIHQVISGETPPMPKFQPSVQEMSDLLSYLESL